MTETAVANTALTELVASLADNKYFLGRRYAEWCTAAPTLESAVAAAAMAQDEIGHARSFYPLLRDLAGSSTETEAETRTEWRHVPFLADPFNGWTDFVAANFLFDTAMTILLEACSVSTFTPLSQRARRILEEEPLHWLHGEGWTRRLAGKGEGVRSALLSSFAQVAPECLDWFQIAEPELIDQGILTSGAEELRATMRARVNPVLELSSLPPV